MPDEVLKDSVFKFVSVRPPQKPRDESVRIRFAAYGQDNEPPLQKKIAALAGQQNAPTNAVALAKTS